MNHPLLPMTRLIPGYGDRQDVPIDHHVRTFRVQNKLFVSRAVKCTVAYSHDFVGPLEGHWEWFDPNRPGRNDYYPGRLMTVYVEDQEAFAARFE